MSKESEAHRAASKKKAERLCAEDPHKRVDSSTWKPSEVINADKKTGMRPLSGRNFKKGGKVIGIQGQTGLYRADRKPRKGGGRAESDSLDPFTINEDFKKDRKSTRLNSSHIPLSRMPSSA